MDIKFIRTTAKAMFDHSRSELDLATKCLYDGDHLGGNRHTIVAAILAKIADSLLTAIKEHEA